MINIAICDDDKKDGERIKGLIQNYMQMTEEEFELRLFESGEEFLESDFVSDILFLDIVMDEKDGIQIGADIRRKYSEIIIIYTTCLREKIAEALNQIHSFGYLVKPIEEEKLFLLLSDAITELQKFRIDDKVSFLLDGHVLIELRARDIYYFEYCDRKVRIVTKKKSYLCVKEKINNLAEKMEKYGFAMAHQSFVVNMYHVDKISAHMLVMQNGEKICLAQKRAAVFRRKLMEIAKGQE